MHQLKSPGWLIASLLQNRTYLCRSLYFQFDSVVGCSFNLVEIFGSFHRFFIAYRMSTAKFSVQKMCKLKRQVHTYVTFWTSYSYFMAKWKCALKKNFSLCQGLVQSSLFSGSIFSFRD